MGNKSSVNVLSDDEFDEYVQLTYLTRHEIRSIMDRFSQLGGEVVTNRQHRYPVKKVWKVYPELKHNPFRDRITEVFSSCHDNCFSFEDVLDLFSVLSENCPEHVKALWAFKLFDVDEDRQISEDDIIEIITRLTEVVGEDEVLTDKEKQHIAKIILDELDLDKTGGVAPLEFVHAVRKIPEFASGFRLKL